MAYILNENLNRSIRHSTLGMNGPSICLYTVSMTYATRISIFYLFAAIWPFKTFASLSSPDKPHYDFVSTNNKFCYGNKEFMIQGCYNII